MQRSEVSQGPLVRFGQKQPELLTNQCDSDGVSLMLICKGRQASIDFHHTRSIVGIAQGVSGSVTH
jgi:hypothetical protein